MPRRTIKTLLFVLELLVLIMPAPIAHAADGPVEIRLGTLAPSGSSYHKILLELGEKWRLASGGAVKLIIFPDGRQGGEADMVRKVRAGQLTAGMFTAVGLSEIDNSSACLQFMPLMFRSWEEVDYVREKLRAKLEKRLSDKGFVVLFWGDAGWVRYFLKYPAAGPAEFKKLKIFARNRPRHRHTQRRG